MVMQSTSLDNVVLLKDAPAFWRKPAYVRSSACLNQQVDLEIYFPLFFGDTLPVQTWPCVTRLAVIKNNTSKDKLYFVGLLTQLRQLSAYSYPPNSTNHIDPVGMVPAKVRSVLPITKEEYDLRWSEYKPTTPQLLLDALHLVSNLTKTH